MTVVRRRASILANSLIAAAICSTAAHADPVTDRLQKMGLTDGIVVVLDVPEDGSTLLRELTENDGPIVYFQSADPVQAAAARDIAEQAGLLGRQVFDDAGLHDPTTCVRGGDAMMICPAAHAGVACLPVRRPIRGEYHET